MSKIRCDEESEKFCKFFFNLCTRGAPVPKWARDKNHCPERKTTPAGAAARFMHAKASAFSGHAVSGAGRGETLLRLPDRPT
jgi:hypothetical protein